MELEIHVLDAEDGKVVSVFTPDGMIYGDPTITSKAIHLLVTSIARHPFISDKGKSPNGA